MTTLQKAAEVIVKECMAARPGEKVLIITDERRKEIADAIFEEAKKITETKLIKIPVGKQHGEEPSKEVAEEMKRYDVVIIPTTKSLTHTNARREACKAGARIATQAGITEEIMQRCVDIDYHKLKETHEKLRGKLISSHEIKITTELGTDITTSVINTRGETAGLYREKGDFGNLPTGEVDSGVKEGATNGIIVVDASFGGLGKLRHPITLFIDDGYIKEIKGEKAEELKSLLDPIGKQAYRIAELGIGTNPKAKVTGNPLEDEKVLGTVHFGIGNDLAYGGHNNVPIHIDGIIKKPTILVDGINIMEKGELLI